MRTIFVNALSLNIGGGRSIRDSYLRLLNEDRLTERYIVLVAKGTIPDFVNNPLVQVMDLPAFCNKTIMIPLVHRIALGRLTRKLKVDVVLNFCDVVMRTDAKQIYVLDYPYVFDVHPRVFVGMEPYLRLVAWAKIALHRLYFHEPNVVVAQTDLARTVLIRKFGLKDVRVVGNAVTVDATTCEGSHYFHLPEGIRLLYPTAYYPHKNLEVLLDVAEAIKVQGLKYRIVTTVAPNCVGARRFIAAILDRGLSDVITNLGQIPLPRMQDLYRQCNAVLMPTLLESFSIVYLEAMYHRIPIFTSDLDFARAVCGVGARYFNPLDPNDILRSIHVVFGDEVIRHALIEAGSQHLESLPTWPQVYASFKNLIRELVAEADHS